MGHWYPGRGRRVGDAARRMPSTSVRSISELQGFLTTEDLKAMDLQSQRNAVEQEKIDRKLKTKVVRVVKAGPKLRKRRDKRRRIKRVGKSTTILYRKLKAK